MSHQALPCHLWLLCLLTEVLLLALISLLVTGSRRGSGGGRSTKLVGLSQKQPWKGFPGVTPGQFMRNPAGHTRDRE